jgi:hypothetical protein
MKIKVGQSEARLFGRAGESVTRSDRRERELEFESSFPPLTARPNRRREGTRGLTTQSSPLGGAPNQHETSGKTLTPVGHPFMTPSERRFAPTTVRQARNGVRYGLEQVSAFIGIRRERCRVNWWCGRPKVVTVPCGQSFTGTPRLGELSTGFSTVSRAS